MAILLLLLGVYIARPFMQDLFYERPAARSAEAVPTGPLPTANGVSNLKVTRAADGRWIASFDYAYTGEPKGVTVRVFQVINGGAWGTPMDRQVGGRRAIPGTHSFSTEVFNPNVHDMHTTEKVFAQMDVVPAQPIAKISVDHRIQWPDPIKTEVEQALAAGKADAIVQKAVGLIDSGQEFHLKNARKLLQMLVDQSPGTDAAYVELARVAMKTSWNASGLREAETLIGSALQIRPDSVNAKILLGYVYAHQGRYKPAEALFAEAAVTNPPNLWLWANWGQVLAMQGKTDAGIQKYREAVLRPPTQDTYDRARWDAYRHLLPLLEHRDDLAGMETLLKQRAQEYPGKGCFGVDYARFLVLQRGDATGAQAVMRDAPSPACDESRKRLAEGLVRYVAWAQGGDAERAELLRQARVFHPVNPALFYALASSERAVPVARQLLAAGEKISMQDEHQFDALAYALQNGESAIARRLLRMGANPVAEIGPQKMPVALIPVVSRDFDSIRLMQRSGVDYAKLRYQGTTAIDHARKEGDTKLLRLLDPKAGNV
jgi:tetratricopeptide (TPR) repeat protein